MAWLTVYVPVPIEPFFLMTKLSDGKLAIPERPDIVNSFNPLITSVVAEALVLKVV